MQGNSLITVAIDVRTNPVDRDWSWKSLCPLAQLLVLAQRISEISTHRLNSVGDGVLLSVLTRIKRTVIFNCCDSLVRFLRDSTSLKGLISCLEGPNVTNSTLQKWEVSIYSVLVLGQFPEVSGTRAVSFRALLVSIAWHQQVLSTTTSFSSTWTSKAITRAAHMAAVPCGGRLCSLVSITKVKRLS